MEERDVVIIGAGPAGAATAAALTRRQPRVASTLLVLERSAILGRSCAAAESLSEARVPSVSIERLQFWMNNRPITSSCHTVSGALEGRYFWSVDYHDAQFRHSAGPEFVRAVRSITR